MSVVLGRSVVGNGDRRFDNLSKSHHQSQVNSCCQSNVLRTVRVSRLASLAVLYKVRFLCYHCTSPVPPPSLSQLFLSLLTPLYTNRIEKGVDGMKKVSLYLKLDRLWLTHNTSEQKKCTVHDQSTRAVFAFSLKRQSSSSFGNGSNDMNQFF